MYCVSYVIVGKVRQVAHSGWMRKADGECRFGKPPKLFNYLSRLGANFDSLLCNLNFYFIITLNRIIK